MTQKLQIMTQRLKIQQNLLEISINRIFQTADFWLLIDAKSSECTYREEKPWQVTTR